MTDQALLPDSFGFVVNDVARLVRAELDRRSTEAGLGLTAGEGRVLARVGRSGALRQNELAETLGVEPMTLSGLVDRLEAKGLVERRPDERDRRAKRVHPTARGVEVLGIIGPIGAGIRHDVERVLGDKDWQELNRLLLLARAALFDIRAAAARETAA